MPDEIKLGWRTYSILFGRRTNDKEGETIWGEIDYERNTIFLNEDGNIDTKQATLLHEIIHWILYTSGQVKVNNDEGVIECLTNHLMMVFRDNPGLAKQIFEQQE